MSVGDTVFPISTDVKLILQFSSQSKEIGRIHANLYASICLYSTNEYIVK